VGRGGSATRGALRGAGRSLRSAKSLHDIVGALRPIAGATLVDVGSRARTIGGHGVRWTPVGFVDETGSVARVHLGTSRGPLSRLTRVVGHDPTTTFRSGQYLVRRTTEPMTLYRVRSPQGRLVGNYWTAIEPRGPGQSQIDSALQPAWRNTAQEVTEIRVPAGTTIYEGIAGPQPLLPGTSAAPSRSGLLGGGHQVFIPSVPDGWIVASRPFSAVSTP
ncbi:MAG: hypothetical protein M3O70_13885, partial [Actinomycetota bacterium]|nr:hypothetical protein [Actinomycetota bacterium]